jgi:hypothetical protein
LQPAHSTANSPAFVRRPGYASRGLNTFTDLPFQFDAVNSCLGCETTGCPVPMSRIANKEFDTDEATFQQHLQLPNKELILYINFIKN